jgi:hypothetical protein
MIPKMDYAIVYKDGEYDILNECYNAARKQSNVNRIFTEKILDNDGASARARALQRATTDYVAVIDYTCELPNNWIEDVCNKYHLLYDGHMGGLDIITGRAATHRMIAERLSKTLKERFIKNNGWSACVEFAIMRKDALDGFKGISDADVGELISHYCSINKKFWLEIPVIAMRCHSFKYHAYREGKLGCIGAIKAGMQTTRGKLIKSAFRGMLGGFIVSLHEGHDLYFTREVKRGFGILACAMHFNKYKRTNYV